MDAYTSPDGVTYTMDTAERYTFEQARERLHRDMGRKWGAYALFHAGIEGECTVGGTKVTRVTWDAKTTRHTALFTITDAPPDYQVRTCRNCGGELNDVEWTFDPCPDSEEGDHQEASE